MKKIREKKDWSAKKLYDLISGMTIDLNTEYQRETIWNKEKRGLLIDSMLNDIDIPKIYLAKFKDGKRYECVDGKQRLNTICEFFENKIRRYDGRNYVEYYGKLSPEERAKFEDYTFAVIILLEPSDEYVREIFDRLNLGESLNGGERLHAMMGEMRTFIFNEIGKGGPFMGKLGLGTYRFSRELALAQIAINSTYFREKKPDKKTEFVRARFEDLEDFFYDHKEPSEEDKPKTEKIKNNLKMLEDAFDGGSKKLTSRASIVSAYLFAEELVDSGKEQDLSKFTEFYLKLLNEIRKQTAFVREYEEPTNKIILEKFHKNLQQASVEGYSIDRRHKFLKEAFAYYKKHGEIIGD